MESMAQLKTTMQALQLPTAADALNEFLMKAEEKQWTNQELLGHLLTHELNSREHNRLEKRLKLASFPEYLQLYEQAQQLFDLLRVNPYDNSYSRKLSGR